jgi:hypothetical protein
VVDFAEDSKDSVDVVVLSKDIFSLGAKDKDRYTNKRAAGNSG